ncbi:MAG TPA: GWxTD domain-containing protein [Candidatus Aminicenantes bacterium]|nr:GWxTD domain-containing protein [Candidatus Aminicenantes bacterium]
MKRVLAVVLPGLLLGMYCLQAATRKISDLPEKYRKWLTEEVVYIITQVEKNAFLQLDNDRERDIFIEAFWKQRDPNPNTEENEFRTEHMERIAYANLWYGREEPAPGWRSDQGKIYIILGKANQVNKYYNLSEVKNMEVWFYSPKPEMGLYNAFNVVFFKHSPTETFRLYSPIKYGPAALLNNFRGDVVDHQAAYNELYRVDPAIANVSLTLYPNETHVTGSPSISSEILINSKIPQAPSVKVNTGYAEKIVKYRGIVNVNYLVNYVERDAMVRVLRDRSGIAFLHYIIEPKRLTLERYDDDLYTTIEVSGRITDLEGKTIHQFNRKSPVKMEAGRTSALTSRSFSFQDLIPVMSGVFKYNILLRNSARDEFTTIEGDMLVPDYQGLGMSPLLLSHHTTPDSGARFKPFLLGDTQLVPSPRNDFNSSDTLTLHFQLYDVPAELKASGRIEAAIRADRDKKVVWSKKLAMAEMPATDNVFLSLPLQDFPTDYFNVDVRVMDHNQRPVLQEQASFYIAPYRLRRAVVMSLPYSRDKAAVNSHILGNQYRLSGKLDKARGLLERAHNADPLSPLYARDYAGLLLYLKEYDRLPDVIRPFLEGEHKNMFLMIRVELARRRGDWQSALDLGEEYLKHNGINRHVLNVMGESLMHLGNRDEAIRLFTRSLEEEPNQPSVREMVEKLKTEKKDGAKSNQKPQ